MNRIQRDIDLAAELLDRVQTRLDTYTLNAVRRNPALLQHLDGILDAIRLSAKIAILASTIRETSREAGIPADNLHRPNSVRHVGERSDPDRDTTGRR
jgi:hypothetical protein